MSEQIELAMQDFFFEKSLYHEEVFDAELAKIIQSGGRFETLKVMGFCLYCQGDRPFAVSTERTGLGTGEKPLKSSISANPERHIQVQKLTCVKCRQVYRYLIKSEVKEEALIGITKIGQDPTLADISQKKKGQILKLIERYFSALDRNEFNKALGLYAHGEGIAPLVFLRRIIERLIAKAFNDHKEAKGWEDSQLHRLRMKEKITFLKEHLPDSLVEYADIYGIMSKGIHELTEQECRSAFPDLIMAIEFIIQDKVRVEEEKDQRQALKARIKGTVAKLNQNK